MTAVDHNLTGRWVGVFNYPDLYPPNNFEADLRDVAGLISGLTSEPNDAPDLPGEMLHAVIAGTRHGNTLSFTKTYDELELAPDAVRYDGLVQPCGNEIVGRWTIPGEWSGTFLMIRSSAQGETIESRASETV